ncbi:sugar phosphate isomerase/epimerase family protein [Salinicoccus halitifaciens]|uniref:Sugar phosphate isomerase/epimerase n=1 Tax=Salinicoccus halitifaciens TaxID=1073415 RepID=A0ABV2E6K9_9STAP|nr:sugar phosphate isomerase/epimerase family protein [Salinicoccus halitifaciens]MCD2136876.1 sugar phosphate isomerase/epimerase [Salinicoccus halitifaciens]
MFKIATSTDVIRHLPFEEALQLIRDTGFEGVEIWMGHVNQSGLSAREIKKLMSRHRFDYQVHADVRDVNLTSINPGIRKESIRQTKETLEFCRDIGAELLILHPGRMSSSKDKPEDLWPVQIETFKEIADHAEKTGVKIGIENMEKRPKEFINTAAEMCRLIKAVDHPLIGMTLDLAHCHSVGDVEEYIRKIDVPVFNVHISQADHEKMHLPFNSSSRDLINFEEVMHVLSSIYSGMIVNESYDGKDPEAVLKEAFHAMKHLNSEIIK